MIVNRVSIARPPIDTSIMVSVPLSVCSLGHTERIDEYVGKLVSGVMDAYPVDSSISSILSMLSDGYPLTMSVLDLEVVHNVVNGIWSGFPNCCIWDYSVNGNSGWKAEARRGKDIECGYVRCDECIAEDRRALNLRTGYFTYWDGGWNFKV